MIFKGLAFFLCFFFKYTKQTTICYSNQFAYVYCDDGYHCCGNGGQNYEYWCCRKSTHTCGSDTMTCKFAVWLIIVIIGIILASVGACTFIIIRRRKRLRQRQQQQYLDQQQKLPEQVPVFVQPMSGIPIGGSGQPMIYYQPMPGQQFYSQQANMNLTQGQQNQNLYQQQQSPPPQQ